MPLIYEYWIPFLIAGCAVGVGLLGYVFISWFFLARIDAKVRQERRDADLQRQAVEERQVSAQGNIQESMRMQRQALEMTERFVRQQDEIIKLLTRIAQAVEARSGATCAEQGTSEERASY
jgi:hypothetical protein